MQSNSTTTRRRQCNCSSAKSPRSAHCNRRSVSRRYLKSMGVDESSSEIETAAVWKPSHRMRIGLECFGWGCISPRRTTQAKEL
eukprot:1391641-Amphidinium_carterae.2